MYNCFKGCRALVTGAGKGVGRGVALRLSELGANVCAISRTEADLVSLKEQVPSIETLTLDIADWDTTRRAVKEMGRFDFLVNNAAVHIVKDFLDVTKEDLHSSFNINFMAAYNIGQVVAKGMVDSGKGGSIVNVCSNSANRAFPSESAYSTTKAALQMLTMAMASELGPSNIRVNGVNLTYVYTNMVKDFLDVKENYDQAIASIPLRRIAEVKDAVDPIVYLLSDQSAMISGASLLVDGASTFS